MKRRKYILQRIALHNFRQEIKRRRLKQKKRRNECEANLNFKKSLNGDLSPENIINSTLTASTRYLFDNNDSPLSWSAIQSIADDYDGEIIIPENFSLIENPEESYDAICRIVASSFFQSHKNIIIDYTKCKTFTIEAQVLLDLILKDVLRVFAKFNRHKRNKKYIRRIKDRSTKGSNVRNMLYSVGSMAIHANKKQEYPNVIPYNLCIHQAVNDSMKQIEQKELDTTSLADYVEKCLARMGRELDGDSWDDLYTVIGEILINAEEHSSTRCRYSIGYFEEKEINCEKVGVFQLVIMNMGRSIYEKFHDIDCPNKTVVEKMKKLSSKYTQRGLFKRKYFEEQALWTLYSLQDGVTSVSPTEYPHRGNGSLRFIESFFNLKNSNREDNVSKMVLQSGKTNITFDGLYGTSERVVNGETYKVMTFNSSHNIEEIPDTNYVKMTNHYFPGTFICAKIII